MTSRQALWQAHKRSQGLCTICGVYPLAGAYCCERCLEKRRERWWRLLGRPMPLVKSARGRKRQPPKSSLAKIVQTKI